MSWWKMVNAINCEIKCDWDLIIAWLTVTGEGRGGGGVGGGQDYDLITF